MSMGDMTSQFALDMSGFQRLQHNARLDPEAGVQGAAQQFEALFIQMMVKSMRDATPTSGLLDSRDTTFYQSMLDQQWSQVMASRGIGCRSTKPVLITQRCPWRSRGHCRARPKRLGTIHQVAAGRIKKDSRHR